MRRPGSDGSHQQHGFAWEGNAGALDRHKEQQRPIAVRGEQMGQPRGVEVKHLSAPFSAGHATTRNDLFNQPLAPRPRIFSTTHTSPVGASWYAHSQA